MMGGVCMALGTGSWLSLTYSESLGGHMVKPGCGLFPIGSDNPSTFQTVGLCRTSHGLWWWQCLAFGRKYVLANTLMTDLGV